MSEKQEDEEQEQVEVDPVEDEVPTIPVGRQIPRTPPQASFFCRHLSDIRIAGGI